ncbi:hypothetical protein NH340_JMT07455 [Sarcoptes scabiei]|nr:hypothetical protein NH340_JMT07455 [Sarcoptes scabiei]
MPPDVFTVKDFIHETRDDFSSPTTSTFYLNISHCKQLVNSIEESLDLDRNGLSKMKKAVKAMYNGGCTSSENKIFLSESLEKLGINSTCREREEYIGGAFVKFSFITKELSALEKNLMQSLYNIIMFPIDSLVKGDLKGVKNDLKKPVDKALKEYEIKMTKIEKEKKAQAKEVGLIRTEISGAEMAEEMDRERKQLQFQLCEYLIKVNDIETKKSFDLLLHFIEYFNAQCKYFRGALESIEQFQTFISDLGVQLQQSRQRKEDEKRELIDLRNLLKSSNFIETYSLNTSVTNDSSEVSTNRRSIGYSLHQLQGNKHYGCYKSGYLLKKSESKMRVKVWQKRKCEVKDGFLHIWHSDESKPPTKINLLTCQIKTCQSNQDEKAQSSLTNQNTSSSNLKNCGSYFDLVSCNRTYHFQVEDENDTEAWISVLINNKEGALKREFDSTAFERSKINDFDSLRTIDNPLCDQNIANIRKILIEQIRKLPGNDRCVDCGSTQDPTWLATNFGVLTCIECSGIHRELGVHVSRIQSLILDNIGTSHLLIARTMSNLGFNDIMEAGCSKALKPKPTNSMDERNQFIRNKYVHRKYCHKSASTEEQLLGDLERAIYSKDIFSLLQAWAEGVNLSSILPSSSANETALHLIIKRETDGCSLNLVDFLIQNASNIDATTSPDGNTPLHYCVIYNRLECMKLLLRSRANYSLKNKSGKTPMDLAREDNNVYLIELLEGAEKNQTTLFENVLVDSFFLEEPSTDFSDDDLDFDKNCVNRSDDLQRSTANRLRLSNRKYSFKYVNNTESESDSNEMNNQHNAAPKLSVSAIQNSNNLRPASVVGDFNAMQIEANTNSQYTISKSSATKSSSSSSNTTKPITKSSTTQITNEKIHQHDSFGGVVTDFASKPKDLSNKSEKFLSTRQFISGHSRAASADMGTDLRASNLKQILKNPLISNPSANIVKKSESSTNQSPNYHTRNNSMDNSLVTFVDSSSYFTKKSSGDSNQPFQTKPAVPVKPTGIVSVFVPGSSNSTGSTHSITRSIGNIHGSCIATDNSHPIPPPRKKIIDSSLNSGKLRRCLALYDCDADQADEFSFKAGEIIVVTNETTNDEEWMEGYVESDTFRRGLFPAIFVQFLDS